LVGYGRQGVVASTVSKLSPSDKVEPKYLYYALSERFDWIQHRRTGTGVPHVPKDLGRLLKLRYPKQRTIQQRIATILSGIDTAIEKTEALIAKYQQIKAGLMHLFTRGLLPNGQLRPPREQAPELYQETAIGWIPRDWDASDCSIEFAIESGITLGQHRRPRKRPRAYLRVANVHRDELRLEDLAYLEVLPNEIVSTLQEFDLLIVEGHANRAEIGRCAMVTAEASGLLFQNHLFRLRPHRLDHFYALDWLNSHYAMRHWETMCSTSSGLNTINRRMLGRMFVAVPSSFEQGLIAQRARGAKKRLGMELQKLHKLRSQKLGLMNDLLTGKVRVKVEELEVVDG
jgi:type I restriction enzyme S subunit